jgi:spore coat protein A, manganese oxidase
MAGITRRRFIQAGMAAAGTLSIPWVGGIPRAYASPGGKLVKFMEPLPRPGAGIVVARPSEANTYRFTCRQIFRRLHPQLPETPLWAYDDGQGLAGQAGAFGMALIAQSGIPIKAQYTNALPETYPDWLPVDTRLTPANTARVRILSHLHGGFVGADSDGSPAARPEGFGPGETQTAFYPNEAVHTPATMLWFHDHALGATRLNVLAGLAGAYIVRDANDTGLEPNPAGLPGGDYELPLVIQDRQFNADGTFSIRAATSPE